MGFDACGRKLNEVCSEMRESDSQCSLDRWRTWLQLKLPESLDRMSPPARGPCGCKKRFFLSRDHLVNKTMRTIKQIEAMVSLHPLENVFVDGCATVEMAQQL